MSLEFKRLKMDLLKAQAAKAELEFKIEERLQEIQRIEDHIKLQDARIKETEAKLEELSEKQRES